VNTGISSGPSITVVIPTYQRRSVVIASVNSVLAQDHTPDEIIVVDDGSTDGTADALSHKFGRRVSVLRQKNLGPSAARNAGVTMASGGLIAFLDSDNTWLPQHLTMIRALFDRYPDAVLVSTQRDYRFGTEDPSNARFDSLAEDLLLSTAGVGFLSSVAVRRDVLLDVGGFGENMRHGEDNELFLRLSLQGPFALMAGKTVVKGHSADSLSEEGRRTGVDVQTLRISGQRMLDELDGSDRPDAEKLRAAAAARIAIGALIEGLVNGSPVPQLRTHVAQIRRLAPRLEARPVSVAWLLPSKVPGWDRPAHRVRTLILLLRSWPLTPKTGYLWLMAGGLMVAFRPPPNRRT
jgi:glycosyltransferase involved in cell wall biosynthesis